MQTSVVRTDMLDTARRKDLFIALMRLFDIHQSLRSCRILSLALRNHNECYPYPPVPSTCSCPPSPSSNASDIGYKFRVLSDGLRLTQGRNKSDSRKVGSPSESRAVEVG